jgi:hypothetical protein
MKAMSVTTVSNPEGLELVYTSLNCTMQQYSSERKQ